jgi:hypothetical protein
LSTSLKAVKRYKLSLIEVSWKFLNISGNLKPRKTLISSKRLWPLESRSFMDYLQSVTGAVFIDDFLGAVDAIYQAKDVFLNALNLQEDFKDPAKSQLVLSDGR